MSGTDSRARDIRVVSEVAVSVTVPGARLTVRPSVSIATTPGVELVQLAGTCSAVDPVKDQTPKDTARPTRIDVSAGRITTAGVGSDGVELVWPQPAAARSQTIRSTAIVL
jgi:hypothetical protein